MLTSRSRRSQAATARSARSSAPATTTPTTRITTNSARRRLAVRCRRLPAGWYPHLGAGPYRGAPEEVRGGGPVSRVLFTPTRTGAPARPGRHRGGPSFIWRTRRRRTAPARHSSSLPASPRTASPEGPPSCGEQPDPLLGFAPGEVCHTSGVAAGVVGSYPTVSPLPDAPSLAARLPGGLFSAALSVARALARTPGDYPAPCSSEPGLSSTPEPDAAMAGPPPVAFTVADHTRSGQRAGRGQRAGAGPRPAARVQASSDAWSSSASSVAS